MQPRWNRQAGRLLELELLMMFGIVLIYLAAYGVARWLGIEGRTAPLGAAAATALLLGGLWVLFGVLTHRENVMTVRRALDSVVAGDEDRLRSLSTLGVGVQTFVSAEFVRRPTVLDSIAAPGRLQDDLLRIAASALLHTRNEELLRRRLVAHAAGIPVRHAPHVMQLFGRLPEVAGIAASFLSRATDIERRELLRDILHRHDDDADWDRMWIPVLAPWKAELFTIDTWRKDRLEKALR